MVDDVGTTSRLPSIELFGISVASIDADTAQAAVVRLMRHAQPATLAFVNSHSLNLAYEDEEYRAALRRAALVLPDGSGVALAGRLLGKRFPANLNGTDFIPRILALAAEHGWRVFLFGGRPGVAERAADILQRSTDGLAVVGFCDGFASAAESSAVVSRIRVSKADIVLVAMGNPKQELWLERYLTETGASLGIAAGAFLDFSAGVVPRAPRWMRERGIEWLWRLAQEPGRLWRRYIIGNPQFILRVMRQVPQSARARK